MAQQILAVKKEKQKHSKCFVSSCPLEITCSVALSFLKTLLVSKSFLVYTYRLMNPRHHARELVS